MESCWKWIHWILAIDWWFPDELSSGWFTEPSLSQVFRAPVSRKLGRSWAWAGGPLVTILAL